MTAAAALRVDVDVRLAQRRRSWMPIPEFPELRPFLRHVALLLVQDVSQLGIAQELGVKLSTIYTATYHILERLDIVGLAGLTRLAIRRGYIQP